MHTEIRYEGEENEKERRACTDILQWFGPKKYRELVRDIRGAHIHEGLTEDKLHMIFGIGGVQGYPVTAFWNRYIVKGEKK